MFPSPQTLKYMWKWPISQIFQIIAVCIFKKKQKKKTNKQKNKTNVGNTHNTHHPSLLSPHLPTPSGSVLITSSTFITFLFYSTFKAFLLYTTLPITHSLTPTTHKEPLIWAPNKPPASLHMQIVNFPLFSTQPSFVYSLSL